MPHGDLQRERPPRVLARSGRWRAVGHLGHGRNPSSCGTTEPGHWCRAGDRRLRGRSRVQTQVARTSKKKRQKKKKKALRQPRRQPPRVMQSGPAETCFFFPISRPWSTHCFHGAERRLNGTHLPLHGCCMSRTLQPKESTGCPSLPHTRGKIEHAPMPQTRSFFSGGGGEPATTPCPDDLHEYGLALSFVCAKIESWCLVCVEWPPNLFDAPDQQCIV